MSKENSNWQEFAARPPEPAASSFRPARAESTADPAGHRDDRTEPGPEDADIPTNRHTMDDPVECSADESQQNTDPSRELAEMVNALREEVRHSGQVYGEQRVLVDKLHEENQRLRRAEIERMRDPIVRDLISLADTCLRNGRAWLQRTSVNPADVDQVLREVSDDVGLILERQGVDIFQPQVGAMFDRGEARVVRSIETTDTRLRNVVAEVLKPGYRIGDRVIRYGEVAIWTTAEPVGKDADHD